MIKQVGTPTLPTAISVKSSSSMRALWFLIWFLNETMPAKSYGQVWVGVPNRGLKSGSQIGVPNRGPKSGSHIGVPYHPPNQGPKLGSQIRVPYFKVPYHPPCLLTCPYSLLKCAFRNKNVHLSKCQNVTIEGVKVGQSYSKGGG
jgi:hypothetical protein